MKDIDVEKLEAYADLQPGTKVWYHGKKWRILSGGFLIWIVHPSWLPPWLAGFGSSRLVVADELDYVEGER